MSATDLQQVWREAIEAQRAGEYRQAESLYRQLLLAAPREPRVWYQLGILTLETGQCAAAADCFTQTLTLHPDYPSAYLGLAEAQRSCGRWAEAAEAFEQAWLRDPPSLSVCRGIAECCLNLGRALEATSWLERAAQLDPTNAAIPWLTGNAWLLSGEPARAAACYQQALRMQPHYPMAIGYLGVAQRQLGQWDAALASLQAALALAPDSAETHNNLGNVWEDLGQLDRAADEYEQATRLQPNYAVAHNNLANIWQKQGRLDDALARAQHALAMSPRAPEVFNCLGTIYQALGLLDKARSALEQALAITPRYVEALNNLGNVLQAQGRLDESVAVYDRALQIAPEHPAVHVNRAMSRLLTGNLAAGWSDYQWRLRRPGIVPNWPQPAWDGSDLAGRTILLYAEQGFGDTLQFVRYAPLVRQRGGRIVLQCHKELAALLHRMPEVDSVSTRDEPPPPFDVHAALLSLPAILATRLETIPASVPYLEADPRLVAAWRDEWSPAKAAEPARFRVGLAWRGNPKNVRDRVRSIALAEFSPLAEVPGVEWFSLQRGSGREELPDWPTERRLVDLADRLFDFDQTAAAIMNLDLVITCDSVCAHLAGALGRTAWVALPAVGDWRWLLEREDSPWYPTLRLYRQSESGRWASVVRRMADDLAALVKHPRD